MALSLTVNKRQINSLTLVVTGLPSNTTYNLYYVVTTPNNPVSWTLKYENTTGTSKTFNVTGLEEATLYACQIGYGSNPSNLTKSSTVFQTTNTRPTQEIVSYTAKSITVKVTADTTMSKIRYSTDAGEFWSTGELPVNSNTFTYTIVGLSPNVQYKIKTKITHANSGADSNTAKTAVTTYYNSITPTWNITETSISGQWRSDFNITNVTSSLGTITGSGGKSGTYNATGLIPDTRYSHTIFGQYSVYGHFKNYQVYNQTDTYTLNSGSMPFFTYQYPFISYFSASNITISDLNTHEYQFELTNPLKRNVTIYAKLISTSGTLLAQMSNITSNGIRERFYIDNDDIANAAPNTSNSKMVIYCAYGNNIVQNEVKTVNFTFDKDFFAPTFTTNNWSYAANLTNLTNNNQVAIKNRSNIVVSLNTAATGKNNAVITKYRAEWGTLYKDRTSTGNFDALQYGSDAILKVTAYDSRTFNTITTKTIPVVNYSDVSLREINAEREDGIGSDVKLEFRGNYFNEKFGDDGVTNELLSAKYYVSTDNQNWSGPFPENEHADDLLNAITYNGTTINLNNYPIHANGASGGFTIGTKYYIKVTIQDKIDIFTFYTTVSNGTLARDVFMDNNGYHEGINGLANPDYAQYIHGNLYADNLPTPQVLDNYLQKSGGTMTGKLILSSQGYEDNSEAGFIHDEYGNMQHKRNNVNDNWHIDAYDGTVKLQVYPETGIIKANGIELNNNYSTTAKAIGIDENNKAIYRIVYTGTISSSSTLITMPSNSTLLDAKIKISTSNGSISYFAPYYASNTDNFRMYYIKSTNKIEIMVGSTYPGTGGAYRLVVDYINN